MRAFLSVILSACLLFSSVTPSLAGVIPGGPRGLGRALRAKPVEVSFNKVSRSLRSYRQLMLPKQLQAGVTRGVAATPRTFGQMTAQGSLTAITAKSVLNNFSATTLRPAEQVTYVYDVLVPSLLGESGTIVVPSSAQVSESADILRAVVTDPKQIGGNTAADLEARGRALVMYAVLSEDAQATVALAKEFLQKGYGPLGNEADNEVIKACLLAGEEGEAYLAELAAQRQAQGLFLSPGFKEVRGLNVAEDAIDPSAAESAYISAEELAQWKELRSDVQEAFNQASAQLTVIEQLSVKPQGAAVPVMGAEREVRTALPELGESANLGLGATEVPAGLETAAAGGSQKPPVPPTTVAAEMPEEMPEGDPSSVEGAIETGLRLAEKDYLANPVHNGTTYAKFLTQHLKETLAKTGADLTTKEVINQLNFALLSPLADFPLLRQQVLDEVTGRTLGFFQKMGRGLATRLAGKQVELPQIDNAQETVLQILTGSKEVPGSLHAATTGSSTRTFTEKILGADGEEVQTQFSYPVHERSLFQLLGVEPSVLQNGTRVGLKDFSYAYSGVLKHRTINKLPKKGGVTATITTEKWNDQTVFFSDQKMNLKPGDQLEVDALGNVYVLKANKSKTERKQLFDRQASVIYLKELGDMPVVFIQKVNDGLSALNRQFFLMGTSSTGRFLNSSLSDQYGDILGGAAKAEQLGTMISTGVYGTNLLALPFKKIVDKVGGKALLKAVLPATIVSFLWATGAVVSGADLHGWGTLVPVIASIAASGTAAAAIQQNANTAMKRMRRGKPASDLVAGGQLRKTLGSGAAYAFYTLATVLTGKWQLMYALVAWPALKAMLALWTTELPLPWQKEPTKAGTAKPNIFKGIAQKATGIMNRASKHAPVEAKPKKEAKKEDKKESFLKDSHVWPLALGLFLFCGSETQSSVATKSILSGVTKSIGAIQSMIQTMTDGIRHLPWMKDVNSAVIEDAFNVFVSGITTIVPLFLGRQAAKKLLAKYENTVPHINEKMMFLSGISATAMMEFMHAVGPELGAWLVVPVMLINGLMGNMFTFALNIMKNRDKAKYNNRFDSLAGTISTLAITGCFFIPTLAKLIFPAAEGVEMTSLVKQQLAFSQLMVPIAAMITGMAINFKHFYNPLNWTKKLSTEEQAKMKEKVLPSFSSAWYNERVNGWVSDLRQNYPNIESNTIQQVLDSQFAIMQTKASKTLGVSEGVLETLARGEDATSVLSDDSLRKLGRMLGISWKDLQTKSAEEINGAVSSYLLRQAAKKLRILSDEHTPLYD